MVSGFDRYFLDSKMFQG
ncbi:MAG: hypothetical protein H7A31_03005 [Thermotogae bacterium]|nr:hypothetical protein [Thermotogota bacterium]